MTPFRVVGSTTRLRADFITVDDLSIEGDDGEQFARTVVRHPGAVAVVPIDAGGKHAILVRQFRSAVAGELLEVPAGKRDVAGEPPATTARRELEEEIGYRAGRLVKLGEFFNSPGFTDEHTHVYCALDLEALDSPHAVTHEEAHMTTERVALDDLDGLITSGALVDAKSIIGLLLTCRYLAGELAGDEC